jgi:hypothetical protein
MSRKQRSYLSNVNRMIILSLTVAGLLMDGFQYSDIPCTVALIFWLWLPTCTRIETKAIDYISTI